MKLILTRLILLCSFGFLLLIPASADEMFHSKYADDLPGNRSELWSPNGRYAVKSIESTKKQIESGAARNKLFFLRKDQMQKLPLKLRLCLLRWSKQSGQVQTGEVNNAFDHYVSVLWSPDSSAFIVNDWSQGPGGYTDAYLYRVSDLAHPVDIGDELERLLTTKFKTNPEVFTGEEVHIFAIRWVNSKAVEINFERRGSGGFEKSYLWNLHDSLKCIKG